MIENFTYPYMPKEEVENELDGEKERNDIKAIDYNEMKHESITAVPSSATLLMCESSGIEELRAFKAKLTATHRAYNSNF